MTLFFASLGMTLFDGAWLWLARAGWTLLTILISLNPRLGFYSVFFFAAWFHPTGFIPDLFFSLKHFQIALVINLIVHALSRKPLETLAVGYKRAGRFYFPWIAILLIGAFNFVRISFNDQAWMTPFNLVTILASMIYLLGWCGQILADYPEEKTVRKALGFFVSGVAIQVFVAFQNTLAGTLYFNMPLFHNNHMGILCSFSSFFAIGLFLSERSAFKRKIWGSTAFVIVSATIASCSRTAWFSFILSFFVFFILTQKFQTALGVRVMRKRHSFLGVLLILAVAFTLSHFYEIISTRFMGIPQLFDWKYWAYTFTDYQNFGFLGILRLQQVYTIKDILTSQPFLGIGFIKNVMDFHGLYFTLLGGTGLLGFASFVYFCRENLNQGFALAVQKKDFESFFLLLASLCAFIAWLICSFLETFIVQFSVWVIFWSLSALMIPVCPQSVSVDENS